MFFTLKKKLMCRTIEKRNRQHPFDYAAAENYTLASDADPLVNNSYYFSAHDEKMSLFARLGKRVHQGETWFALYLDGQLYSLKQELFPVGASPIRVEKKGEQWTLSFEGILNEKDEVVFRAKFVPREQPVDFTTSVPATRMATGMANEKWSKAFFAQLQTISGQCHYEQEGELEGSLSLNGRTVDFRLPCVRDHSFGKRDWNYMNNHLWLMAVSAPLQFNYSLVSYPALTALEVGNFRDGKEQLFLQKADLDLARLSGGRVPETLSFHVTLEGGRILPVTAKVLAGVTYHFQEGQYILHENIAEFEIDGKTCRGILEIGFNQDSSRFFNQRDLRGIRR